MLIYQGNISKQLKKIQKNYGNNHVFRCDHNKTRYPLRGKS
ncbi:hypothetical protein MTBPR1_20232 [Candidatus Terasakiella magnetica]|uniref:Uncharacterized protein n=1 Tax=Candidatus Terasakiella magnetica TaxID=1867952 RepID=A0A1C3RGP8_9PROT|nr:hypothetical protein MTBPR1_20232 [Candidatus Terasakiella magnetica]